MKSLHLGNIHISTNAISNIVSIAVKKTDGISSMAAGLTEGVAKSISGRSLQRGIDVEVKESYVTIQLRIIVKYGYKVHFVCWNLQQNVQKSIENLTGLYVNQIQVQVVGVSI
ncbi:Asp23/Gls24 family envelope stress response protein [Paenibacillus sp. FSL K6-1318]|uniref:Asp23/Gls24 family envelope stress response protein n=1 Tax=Paenibacillus sp. FSL K6-1318 TaxID=2975291 RepID=UPI0030EE9B33